METDRGGICTQSLPTDEEIAEAGALDAGTFLMLLKENRAEHTK